MIILDTNVLSALMQQRPDTPLIQWLDLQPAEMIWVSSITLFEARYEPAEPKRKLPKKFVLSALEQSIDDTGWARLATFGSYLTKLQTDFDSRLYGYKKLLDLVKAKTNLFVIEERRAAGSNQTLLLLRAK